MRTYSCHHDILPNTPPWARKKMGWVLFNHESKSFLSTVLSGIWSEQWESKWLVWPGSQCNTPSTPWAHSTRRYSDRYHVVTATKGNTTDPLPWTSLPMAWGLKYGSFFLELIKMGHMPDMAPPLTGWCYIKKHCKGHTEKCLNQGEMNNTGFTNIWPRAFREILM